MANPFTPHQQAALAEIAEWMNSDKQVYQLTGLAGTGKTYVGVEAVKRYEGYPTAFSGRVAANFSKKAGVEGGTLHNLLYTPQKIRKPIYDLDGKIVDWKTEIIYAYKENNSLQGWFVVVDEAGMIDQKLGSDLLATGAKVLTLGDLGQLPPPGGPRFFREPDFIFTEIMRQAKDSGIIVQSWAVRNGGDYVDDGRDVLVIHPGKRDKRFHVPDETVLWADAVLVWTNSSRVAHNERIRKLHGYHGIPRKGEPMMVLHNCADYRVFNGMIYRLGEDFDPEKDWQAILITEDEQEIRVPRMQLVTDRNTQFDDTRYKTCMDFGYCLTTHKSQGSEFDKVLLIDDYPRRGWNPESMKIAKDWRSWVYTGMTRAQHTLVIAC